MDGGTFIVFDVQGQLEDLASIFSDQPVGTPHDFDISADPDDDLVSEDDQAVEREVSLADLEAPTVWWRVNHWT